VVNVEEKSMSSVVEQIQKSMALYEFLCLDAQVTRSDVERSLRILHPAMFRGEVLDAGTGEGQAMLLKKKTPPAANDLPLGRILVDAVVWLENGKLFVNAPIPLSSSSDDCLNVLMQFSRVVAKRRVKNLEPRLFLRVGFINQEDLVVLADVAKGSDVQVDYDSELLKDWAYLLEKTLAR
jgi:hypothetical protein